MYQVKEDYNTPVPSRTRQTLRAVKRLYISPYVFQVDYEKHIWILMIYIKLSQRNRRNWIRMKVSMSIHRGGQFDVSAVSSGCDLSKGQQPCAQDVGSNSKDSRQQLTPYNATGRSMRPVVPSKDLVVELTSSTDFTDVRKASPCLLTMTYPFFGSYPSNQTYAHINAKEYHRLNRHKQAGRPFIMGPPIDVNHYISF